MSTHFEYVFPPEFARHKPYADNLTFVSSEMRIDPRLMKNRYLNAVGFLDAELGAAVAQLDLQQNLVVVTGDHGESFYDDGKLFHGSRLSTAQTQVPLVFCGALVPRERITRSTTHCDVAPTLFGLLTGDACPLQNTQGRNALAVGDNPAEDQFLLVHGIYGDTSHRHHDRLLLVQDDLRLPLLLSRRTPGVEVLQPVDAADRILLDKTLTPAECARLGEALTREFRRFGPE
jgi:arylsulfatase A-like enzyme